ncbi:MAG: SDR family oxidoreductase [Clostridia bacterium]|nr:SDR family oxidoreductase [Clostridia bacterium]MBP5372614.1 SDR family oxidoreductase [Clostridia bacterium]
MSIHKADLNGKVAIVTGGAGVLCSMFVRALAASGAKVVIAGLDRDTEMGNKIAAEIKAQGGEATFKVMNVLDKEQLKVAHAEILKEYGPCDILINGAGGNSPKASTDCEFHDNDVMNDPTKKSFFDLDPDGFNFVFGLNFNGTLFPTQEFAKDMLGKPGSTIINISSMNSFTPLTKIPAYSAAKAAISNFTKWLATHFAKEGIRVNAIAPGFFSTAQNKALLWNPDGTPTERTGKILRNTPMGRFGEAEELIGTLMWLVDNDMSGFVTGTVIPVDGGFSAYSGV